MALTNAQLKERKRLLDEIAKSEGDIAAHTTVIEKGEGLTNKQLEQRARLRAKDQQTLKDNRKLLSDIQKEEDKINAKAERRNRIAKEFDTIEKDIMESIKSQPKFLRKIDIERTGILANLQKLEKLESMNTSNMNRRQKKELTMRRGIAETEQDILDNSVNVASEEFTIYDLQKKINWARREGDDILVASLENMQEMQSAQKRNNDIAMEGAAAIRAPIDSLRDAIESVPGGKFLSKLMGLETLGDTMSKGLLTAFRTILGLEDKLPDAKEAPGKVMGSKGRMVTEGGKAHKRDVDSGWIEAQEEMAEVQEEATENAEDQAEASEKTKKSTEGAGKAMSKIGFSAIAILAAVIAWVVETVRFSMELGVAYGELSAVAIIFKEQTKAVLAEFGSMRGVSNGLLTDMYKMEKLHGVQAADMAKILVLQTSLTDQTRDMALDEQAKWIKEIKSEGLSARDVFADMAQNADYIAFNMKKGTNNMVDAAKQAAKMGLSLSETASVANKLLDWETSIKDEMELSLLLNRDINFDKARGLMLSGKQSEMMEEVKRQMGGEAAFAKAGVLERMAMADAIGLQGAALAEFMMTDQERVEKEKEAQEKSQAAEQAAAAEKAKMWGIIGGIAGAVIVAIGAGLAAAVSLGTLTGAGIAWTLAGMVAGGSAGYTAGTALANTGGEEIGQGVITPTGQVVKTDPMDYGLFGTGQEFKKGAGSQRGSGVDNKLLGDLVTETRNTNILLSKLPTYLQSEELSRDQVSATKKVGQQI